MVPMQQVCCVFLVIIGQHNKVRTSRMAIDPWAVINYSRAMNHSSLSTEDVISPLSLKKKKNVSALGLLGLLFHKEGITSVTSQQQTGWAQKMNNLIEILGDPEWRTTQYSKIMQRAPLKKELGQKKKNRFPGKTNVSPYKQISCLKAITVIGCLFLPVLLQSSCC